MLQRRQQLREQGSKHSVTRDLLARALSPIPLSRHSNHPDTTLPTPDDSQTASPTRPSSILPSRVVSLTSLAHLAVSSLSRPVSHRHKSAPLRVSRLPSAEHGNQDLFGSVLRASFSEETLPVLAHDSMSSSFDSKVAYKACKKEEGYVNFDKVLGLDNHASREEIAGMVGETGR